MKVVNHLDFDRMLECGESGECGNQGKILVSLLRFFNWDLKIET